MRIGDLLLGQNVSVQFIFKDNKIDFGSSVIEKDVEGVYLKPYVYNGEVLEINIDNTNAVVCNLIADDLLNNDRVSWKNLKVQTVEKAGKKRYYMQTRGFNDLAKSETQRKDERMVVHKNAHVKDPVTHEKTDIIVHDISDGGISFYAPATFAPKSNQIVVTYDDCVDTENFSLHIDCQIVRSEKRVGTIFYGCKIVGNNKNYLLYRFVKRRQKKKEISEE